MFNVKKIIGKLRSDRQASQTYTNGYVDACNDIERALELEKKPEDLEKQDLEKQDFEKQDPVITLLTHYQYGQFAEDMLDMPKFLRRDLFAALEYLWDQKNNEKI
jgi:hypothetical protein